MNYDLNNAVSDATKRTPIRMQELIDDCTSQTVISEQTEIDRTVISRIKNPDDPRDLTTDNLRRLALTYGVSTDWLLGLPNASKYPNAVTLNALSYSDICNIFMKLQSLGILSLYVQNYGMNASGEYEFSSDPEETPEYDFAHVALEDPLLCEALSEYEKAFKEGKRIFSAYKSVYDKELGKVKLINWTDDDAVTPLEKAIDQHIKDRKSKPKREQTKLLDNENIKEILSQIAN